MSGSGRRLHKVPQPHDAIVVMSGAGLGLLLMSGGGLTARNMVLNAQEGRPQELAGSCFRSIHTVKPEAPPVVVISYGGSVYVCEEGKRVNLPNEVRDFLRKFT